MFPETEINNTDAASETAGTKSYLFDFSSGDFIVRDGKLIECDGIDAIKVWIEKILRTEKGRFEIYDDTDYGCHLEDLIVGNNYPLSFVESELKREIEDALLQNPQITGISNFTLTRGTSSIAVTLEVNTAYDAGTNTISVTF